MRNLYFLIIVVFLINCSGNSNTSNSSEVLNNVLTLENSFGDEGIDDKYLLASPTKILVTIDNKVVIADENSLKVFDSEGKPIKIVGRKGQGPNEFETYYLDPTNSLTGTIASRSDNGTGYNIYDNELNFIEKITFVDNKTIEELANSNNFRRITLQKMYQFSEDYRIFYFSGSITETDGNIGYDYRGLIKEKMGEFEIIYKSKFPAFIRTKSMGMSLPYQGSVLYDVLPEEKMVYINVRDYSTSPEGQSEYTLNIIDKNGEIVNKITHQFARVSLPDSLPSYYYRMGDRMPKEMFDGTKSLLKKDPFYKTLDKLLIDGNIIYAFTFSKNSDDATLADVFDAEEGKYLRSAYFSVIPQAIKNGKAYRIKSGQDAFPVVEVYTIDPRVYK